jgi:hypothetical protein
MACVRLVCVLVVGLLAACSRSGAPDVGGSGVPASVAATGSGATGAPLVGSRRVVRTAELSLEVPSPATAATSVAALVERYGGYLESSARRTTGRAGVQHEAPARLTLRTPAGTLSALLGELKRLGAGTETEVTNVEDVTAESIDLEARVSNQRHLEAQLVTLLASARTLEEALKAHQELARVRTEIDQVEGQMRLLSSQVALAKVTLTLTPLEPLFASSLSSFGNSLRDAARDALDLAAGIIAGSIRLLGFLVPLLLLVLPALGLRRMLRPRTA